ncbi:MAG: CBS domain-containing protein [Methanophagales archaeon ANME-1-THS]|nr:MAG: CBS domain-containing protein [Methanophagales archaeon ANME-1-THS]
MVETKTERSIAEINERIADGSVRVVTADRMSDLVSELGPEGAAKEVDVVTTGTFGPMCSSGMFMNFGHADPPIKMQRVWLNDVEAYTGIAAVDAYLGAAQLSDEKGLNYGGGHVIEDLVAGKPVNMRAMGFGTDCYPRKEIETTITLEDLNQAIMLNPRNAYQRYFVATNSSDRTIYTYMGTLLPNYRNVNYSGAGALSPLSNDPDFETIGVGTRIFLCGAKGYVVGMGTQHNPKNRLGTVMVTGNVKEMDPEFLRGATFFGYGVTLFVGIGIPIPILNERMAKKTGIRDADIITEVIDYGVSRRERPVLRRVTYEELKSGMIELEGKAVPTSPLSSFFMASRVAEELKERIEQGRFFLSTPVERLPTDTVFKPMKQTELPLVKDVMIRDVKMISERASIEDAAKLIMESQSTHIPVIAHDGKLAGIVTAWDISTAVATKHQGLADIMTRKVITAGFEEPLELVIRKMERGNISALPVIDTERRVIGMVTSDEISKLIGKRKKWIWKLKI